MNMQNFKVNLGVSILVALSFVLASCGGGSAAGYSPTSTNNNSGSGSPSSSVPAPIVTVTAGSSSIGYNSSTTISWTSTNSTSCTYLGGGGTGTTGSFSTGLLTTTKTYTVSCVGAGGSASQSKTVTVAPSSITGFVNTGGGSVTVTTANTLTNGMIITISGTTSYNGTFTVSNVTPTNFTIVHSFINASETGSWQLEGGVISGCSSTGATSSINLSTVPSRFSGVAPLSVFFDAAGTTATTTTKPFHDIEYRWDFGDVAGSPVSGTTWGTGSRAGVSSRNTANGPEAAHVFETPGIYTISLTANDGTNTVSNNCARIVVLDPDLIFAGTNTICFSTGADFTGCPSGASTVQQSSFSTAINSFQATGKRLLFKRGDTFTAGVTRAYISAEGPGTVGAFGSGALPVIQNIGTTQMLLIGKNAPRNIHDWRVMDLTFDGASDTNASHDNTPIQAGGSAHEMLFLRMNIRAVQRGILANHFTLSAAAGDTIYDGWTVQDSTIRGIPGCVDTNGLNGACDWRIYMVGTHLALQGNDFDSQDTGGTHIVRSEFMQRGVISHNRLANAGGTQHTIKLHAAGWTQNDIRNPGGVGTYSEKIVISGNKIIGHNNAWTVSLGPQSSSYDERVRDVIFENNWITGGAGTQISVESSAARSTFRNNIIDTSNGIYQSAFSIGQRGIEPAPDDVLIYNNTLYSGSATSQYRAVNFGTATNVTVKNNLAYAPNASSPVMIYGTPSGLVQSNNSTNGQVKSTSPVWASATPSVPSDFKPVGGSYALGTGVSVPVYSDFFLQTRLTNSLGAAMQ